MHGVTPARVFVPGSHSLTRLLAPPLAPVFCPSCLVLVLRGCPVAGTAGSGGVTQGGGTAPVDERAVFTAVVYVLTSGCAWRFLPDSFGVSPATAHRRFTVWTEAGVWRRVHRAVLDELGARGELDWLSVIVDAASVRAKRGAR
ncbi:transposase [Streptomyces microflavus]|uniref:transposase n=1 Tax=Streptomyces microflavus TaxID=1919 RepID=UPI00381C8BFB